MKDSLLLKREENYWRRHRDHHSGRCHQNQAVERDRVSEGLVGSQPLTLCAAKTTTKSVSNRSSESL